MKEKKIIIVAKGASQKQWSTLILELNLMRKAWKPVGVDLHMTTPGLERVLSWGTKKYNDSDE